MRIGCLQFGPQQTEIDHNLNRADEVLRKANERILDDLDLLVVPELAITGSNYRSLRAIDPFLEPGTSSTTSLWARTKALKYDCHVCVGYPERKDITSNWPTGPEYYNSAVLVNENGENTCNYRKCFLDPVEQAWALEGPEGFHSQWVDGLGNITLGISTDLNKHTYDKHGNRIHEFAEHVVSSESDLVVITMAWSTRKNPRTYTQIPTEPDWDALEYWILRLQPLHEWSKQNEGEITVVFCNRIGSERGSTNGDETTYAGTSTIIGFRAGEILLYGTLGRGEKSVLCVDTQVRPRQRLEINWPRKVEETGSSRTSTPTRRALGADVRPCTPDSKAHVTGRLEMHSTRGRSYIPDKSAGRKQSLKRESVLFSRPSEPPLVHSAAFADLVRETNRKREDSLRPASRNLSINTCRQPNDDDGVFPTPSAPSPTPINVRPKLEIPVSNGTSLAMTDLDEPMSAMSFLSQTSEHSVQSYVSAMSSFSQASQATVRSMTRAPQDSTPYPWTGVADTATEKFFSWNIEDTLKDWDDLEADDEKGRITPQRIGRSRFRSPSPEGPKTPEAFAWPQASDLLKNQRAHHSSVSSLFPSVESSGNQGSEEQDDLTPIRDDTENDDGITSFMDPILTFAQQTAHLLQTADVAERIRAMASSEPVIPNRPESPKSRNASRSRAGHAADVGRGGTPSPEYRALDAPNADFTTSSDAWRSLLSSRGRPAEAEAGIDVAQPGRMARGGSLPPETHVVQSLPRSVSGNRLPPRAGSHQVRRQSASRRRSNSLQMRDFIMIESRPGSNCPLHPLGPRSSSMASLRAAGPASRDSEVAHIQNDSSAQERGHSTSGVQNHTPEVKEATVVDLSIATIAAPVLMDTGVLATTDKMDGMRDESTIFSPAVVAPTA